VNTSDLDFIRLHIFVELYEVRLHTGTEVIHDKLDELGQRFAGLDKRLQGSLEVWLCLGIGLLIECKTG
jgi:hypothetical protein